MAEDRAKQDAWNIVRFAAPAGLVALGALVLAGKLEPDDAVFAVVAAMVALLLGFTSLDTWEKLAARLEKFEGFGISLGLRESGATASAQVLPEEQDAGTGGSASQGWLDLRLKLEAKLTYIAKIMRPGEERAGAPRPQNFVTVGSLKHDKYISPDEAEIASAVLAPSLVAASDRKVVLERAAKVVGGIRASVFFNMVRKRLQELADSVEEIPRGERRPDLLAKRGDREYRVASAFATNKGSKVLSDVRERLRKTEGDPQARGRIVVIPDESESLPEDATDAPRVIHLSRLQEALQ